MKPITLSYRQLTNGEKIPFLDDNTEDMGSSFALFHEISHHDSQLVDKPYLEKRNFLRTIMKQDGFNEYKLEWWHYTLADEPYPHPQTYFDFIA
ncbi:M15 family metallopeptidase [Candidatus Odyssella thessalonicensis]|uniref:M15 family metallopeptidase n=1 Tax=Candidatus Odyssella thessalonicensis TaxID=84647 RepID=UPI000225A95F|nr:M15 family metallopeptidase [Candidatus Odyssella thessalonicensis]